MKEIMKEEITKEKLTNKLNNTFLRPFRWLMIISMLCIISSIFVLIWGPWALTWKLCLFGISGFIIFGVIHKIMKISIIKGIEELSSGKKHPVLILVDKFTLPTSEVREYLALPETALYTSAEAYVLTSFSQKLAGNIYLSFNKPARPTKFFNSEDKAVEWLKTFL